MKFILLTHLDIFIEIHIKNLLIKGVPPKQLSKEFFRQWLIQNNFQGKENQNLPEIN